MKEGGGARVRLGTKVKKSHDAVHVNVFFVAWQVHSDPWARIHVKNNCPLKALSKFVYLHKKTICRLQMEIYQLSKPQDSHSL
jgi:hypothetical protein